MVLEQLFIKTFAMATKRVPFIKWTPICHTNRFNKDNR